MTDYKEAGVDLDAVRNLKKEIAKIAKETYNSQVLAGVGPFGSMFDLGHSQVLVVTVDGVGTKLKLAQMMNSAMTCGKDLVNHCINDILCQGAKPIFFLDYVAQDRLRPHEVLAIIEGMALACKEAGIPLIGGETSQMPRIYQDGQSDLVGFMAGSAEKHKIIDGHLIRAGDKILGLASRGLHTNGYSLVNKLLERNQWSPYFYFKELNGQLGRVLLAVHKSYLKPIKMILDHRDKLGFYFVIHGIAHITGGGIRENIERILPENCQAKISLGSWPVLPIFQFIQKEGEISDKEMYRVFNMGIGMVLVVSAIEAQEIYDLFQGIGEPVYEIGEVIAGTRSVIFS